jgi:regulator of cell morphogenesis and NO signaling
MQTIEKKENIKIEATQWVGKIASAMPSSIQLFEKLKIDYCCGGNRALQEACQLAGVSLSETLSALKKLQTENRTMDTTDWPNKTMTELINHILDKHHAYTREQLARLKKLSAKVKAVHGAHQPELDRVDKIVQLMAEEMDGHMGKEEEQVFPYLKAVETAGGKKDGIADPFLRESEDTHPLRILMWEHGMTGEEFVELNQLTNNFEPPEDACNSYRGLYHGLKELEQDLHQHVHLENNILFSKAEAAGILD